MFNILTSLIGLRIDDNRIIEFLEKNGFKYPKKPFISNRSTDTSYWVENKKLGVDLLFQAQTYVPGYSLIQGDKKGIFVPVLGRVRWYNNKSKTEFPLGLDFSYNFESLKEKLGEPGIKSSDISPIWLNDDGSESFYRWEIILDDERSHVWGLEYTDNQVIKDFSLGLKYQMPAFYLYSEWGYENFENFMSRHNFDRTADLMFLQWAIERDLVKPSVIATEVKEGKLPVTEWVRALNRGYVLESDFSAEGRFIDAYTANLSGNDILYSRDAAYTFLETPELKQNDYGEAAKKLLNEVSYNEDNYKKIKSLIDKRLTEYKDHGFRQSKQI
ncbi:hypothetical protein [Chitinophaga tropicalis]|uniref:Uncharacterized protein n=1 Tax=Chitinophaga tropicalis TaxID=2683588 RepID=A0A7K1UE50_9BACT|nr:hypothetical protein [Chitinophaga tropicalis]MVT12613.1 hypothetical protein [Chitinophaga tropicalis]